MMDDVIAARALHVLAVVIWIGGVAMATTVALPAVRHGDLGSDKFQAFQAIEHRFAWQARTAIILVGLTGFYMTWRLDLWDRFRDRALLVDACHGLLVAVVRLRPVHRRAVHSAPPFPTLGDSAAGGRLRLAASGALAAAGAERGDDPGRGRGKPGMVDLLNGSGVGHERPADKCAGRTGHGL